MIINILLIIMAFGGGLAAGGALAAFITLINLIPRILELTATGKYVKIYQNIFALGSITFTILYFSDIHFSLPEIYLALIGGIIGMFIGLFSSALAEVLNVIPALSKKLKIKEELKYTIYALMFGKVLGSIYFWIYY